VKQVCEFAKGIDNDGGNESLSQMTWAAPVGKAGVVEQSQPCTLHKPEDYASPYGRAETDSNKISQCGFTLADIEFVSPGIMSVHYYSGQSDDCEPRGGRYSVTSQGKGIRFRCGTELWEVARPTSRGGV